jgi:ankyrin repeat protein
VLYNKTVTALINKDTILILMLTVRCANTAAVLCMLIKAGAAMLAGNREGHTAAQLALGNGHALIATLLNRAAAQQQPAV